MVNKAVSCPTCLKTVAWTKDNQYRPFCSERCKLIDLGDWATGRHAIAGEPLKDQADEPPATAREDFLQY
jgi:endogenous inhibitor of DNA gyrase (YacG/DUF329 family)